MPQGSAFSMPQCRRMAWTQDGGIVAAAGEEVTDLGLDLTGADTADRLHRQHRAQLGPAFQGLKILGRRVHEDAPADQAAVAFAEGVEHRPPEPRPKQVRSKCSRTALQAWS